MGRKNKILNIALIVLIMFPLLFWINIELFKNNTPFLEIKISPDYADTLEVFYRSVSSKKPELKKTQQLNSMNEEIVTIENKNGNIPDKIILRLKKPGNRIKINNVNFLLWGFTEKINLDSRAVKPSLEIDELKFNNGLKFKTLKENSHIVLQTKISEKYKHVLYFYPLLISIFLSLLLAPIIFKALFKYRKTKYLIFYFLASVILVPLIFIGNNHKLFEKRLLEPLPEFKINGIIRYPGRFGDYYKDNFGFRSTIISFHNMVKSAFGFQPMPDKVLIGKDNWLFSNQGNYVNEYTHEDTLSEVDLQRIRGNLLKQERFLNNRGIKYYILVTPVKGSVYNEYLPENIYEYNKRSKLDQLLDYLDEDSLAIIDCRNALQKEKARHILYLKNDTHWNFKGAFTAYSELLKAIQKDFSSVELPSKSDFRINLLEDSKIGDLSQLLAMPERYRADYDWFVNKRINDYTIRANLTKYMDEDFKFGTTVIESQIPDSLKIVLFRDSFSNYFLPFLPNNFSKSTLLWTHIFKPEAVIEENPDIVVHQLVERFIDELNNK